METFGYELEEEFNAITRFVEEKYGIIIKSREQSVDFTKKALTFMMTIKVWKKHMTPTFRKAPKTEMYFQEMLSNAVHIILLGNIDMKIPALVMLRRTQELILTYLFYSEHPVELFKKEMNDNSRTVSGFNELKDYIKNYPYSMKYNVEDAKVQEIVSTMTGIHDSEMKYTDYTWFPEMPQNWDLVLASLLFREDVRPVDADDVSLSLSQVDGLIPTDDMSERSLKSATHDNWKHVIPDDLVLNRFKGHLGVFFASKYTGMNLH